MKIKAGTAIFTTLFIFLIGIAAASAFGIWSTVSSKVPVKFKDAAHAEAYNPADIRGSYTFADISRLYEVPMSDLTSAFSLEAEDASRFKCKDLEARFKGGQYEIGTASVRMFVACYYGLPFSPTEETYLTDRAVKILEDQGNLSDEQRKYLKTHTVPQP